MRKKTIFRDQFGLMSMSRWYLFVLFILAGLQFLAGLTISFVIIFKELPDFIPLVMGLISGTFLESIAGVILKTISKNIEMSNISAREYIEKQLSEVE